MAQKSLISFFIIIVFFLVLLSNLHLAIAETSEKSGSQEVLIVHSDYQGYPWTDSLNVGIKNVISSSPLTINLQFEYLDSKRNRAKYYFEQLRELWNIKYDKRHIDLIIVCSNEAYDFVMLERNNLFLGIPIVFTSYIGFTANILNGKQPITGVVQKTDIISTIDTALLLHPQTKKIVFVAPGAPPFRLAWLDGLEERYAKIVQIHTIIAETTAQIDKEINAEGEDIVVIPLNSVLKSDGTYLPFTQFVSHLSTKRPFPVYALWDIALGQGVVGGKMVSGASQGKEAAKQALQILQGSPVSDVPVVTNSPNQYMFDWEAMKRFKISDNDLPPKSIVINRPITFYAENKTIVHVTITTFFVLFLLILSLFVAIIYLRRTQKNLLASDKTLKASEERYKNFFNNSPIPLWEEDFTAIFQIIEKIRARGIKNFRDFFNQNSLVIEECIKKVKILDVNKACCQLHDAQNKDYLIGNLDKIFSDNSIVAFKEQLIKIAEGKKNIEVAGEVKTLNGEIRFIDLRLNIHERTPGSFVALISTIDVTNRKQVEDKLRKNESLLQRIFDILPIGLWIADKDGKLLQGNLAGVEIWGAEPHVGPEDYGIFRARRLPSMAELAPEDWALTQTITKGVTITDELLEIETFDGRKKTILNYTAPVLDSFNKVEGAVIVNLDISKRVAAEQDAIQSKVRLNTVINTIPDMIWLKDEDGIYLSCNPTFERFFGAKESEIVGKTDYDFVDKELADFFRKNDSKALKNKVSSINEEWLTFQDDGYNGLFETIKLPIYDPNGELVGILGIARDITNRHNAEKEKIMLVRQLKQSQKMESIGKLAGGIAHDFNNILASVLGFSELALDECEKGSTMEDNLQEIYAGGIRAKEIVKQILAFARQSDEELKPTRVDTIIIEALKLIRPTTPTTIEIRKNIESSSLVMGNTTQIHQIILNLCTNAAHAMEDNGGIMEVTLKDIRFGENTKIPGGLNKGKYIELAISDTGSGIEPEHIDSIFDPYFTTKEIGKGTGMGLAMVRGITESYGGTIIVESSPLVKTRFTLYLPITSNLDNEITFETKILPGGNEHILFVDDEPPLARMGSRTLENLGYKVTTRTSSIEALELFKAKSDDFQLVITDMTMPHMTGDKFAIELKQIRADIPIILCTGYSNKINAEIALEIGINAFTYKPFSKADLANCVRDVLDKA